MKTDRGWYLMVVLLVWREKDCYWRVDNPRVDSLRGSLIHGLRVLGSYILNLMVVIHHELIQIDVVKHQEEVLELQAQEEDLEVVEVGLILGIQNYNFELWQVHWSLSFQCVQLRFVQIEDLK